MRVLGNMFSAGSSACLENIDEALIVDVRTPGEFSSGHVEGSINVPLDVINAHINDFKSAGQPLVLCCASGNRSGHATNMLKAHGITCCNGGSWLSVNNAKTYNG